MKLEDPVHLPEKVAQWADDRIRAWPRLFYYDTPEKSRMAALNQLYCVLGNGYEWIDGEPVNCDPDADDLDFEDDAIYKPYCGFPPLFDGAQHTVLDGMNRPWAEGCAWFLESFLRASRAGEDILGFWIYREHTKETVEARLAEQLETILRYIETLPENP